MWLFDLSLRHKIPLWGSVLILFTAAALSASFGFQAYDDLKSDTVRSSEDLGRTLVKTLHTALLHDDVWRAYEIINTAYHGATPAKDPLHAENLIVVNDKQQIFVSNRPDRYPILSELSALGGLFPEVARRLARTQDDRPIMVDRDDSASMLLVLPIVADDVVLGGLVMVHSKSLYTARFNALAGRATLITLVVLAVLLPINWYWGRRMSIPLVSLAERIGTLRERLPDDLEPGIYEYRDELGRLFQAFSTMLSQLREKEYLERQMVQSERMAAIGRLAAGIAHEINNPLAGMLTAIDTLRHHGSVEPLAAKTISLVERGLRQIKDTVAALLVEARIKSHALCAQDVDDVYTLVMPEAQDRAARVELRNAIEGTLPLPSTLIRQVMINLLLNAVQAAGRQGRIMLEAMRDRDRLRIRVSNDGRQIPADQMKYLFEPFNRMSESGHGLGLWVTYQIVQQLGGHVAVESDDGITRFTVEIPLEDEICLQQNTESA
jgi:two-component system, NtrC family, sensor kinase